MEVSFLIPALRNFSDYSLKTIKSIEESRFSFDYEIIICSKSKIEYNKTIWVKEPDENNGSVLPINLAFQAAKGKYFALLNDDFDINQSFENAIKFLESDFYSNRKIKLTAFYPNKWLEQNDMKWIPDSNWNDLPCQMLCFPIGETENIKSNIGENLLDPRFKHHWSDVWLTFYIYKKFNEIIPLCKDGVITMREETCNSFNNDKDQSLYFNLIKDLENIRYS